MVGKPFFAALYSMAGGLITLSDQLNCVTNELLAFPELADLRSLRGQLYPGLLQRMLAFEENTGGYVVTLRRANGLSLRIFCKDIRLIFEALCVTAETTLADVKKDIKARETAECHKRIAW